VEHERRTGRPPSRNEALRGRVQAAYAQSDSREAFLEALAEQGFRHEPRGKISARVIDEYTGKVHRVATLDADLAAKFDSLMSEPVRDEQKQAEQKTARASRESSADEKENIQTQGTDYARSRAEARAEMDRARQVDGSSASDASTGSTSAQEGSEEFGAGEALAEDQSDENAAQQSPESETLREFRERREARAERKREKSLKQHQDKGRSR